ncbi:8432_t:CDS:1, partial [Funneliformis geosporum]
MNYNFNDLDIGNYFKDGVEIFVQIDDPPSQRPKMVKLYRDDDLSKIRGILQKKIEMNDTLLFAKKNNRLLAEILRNEEIYNKLNEILDGNILYLVKNSIPDWKFLNVKRNLDYGRTVTLDGIKIAKKRAFEMKQCKITESDKCKNGKIEFSTYENWVKETNLFFTNDMYVENLVKLEVKFEMEQNKSFKFGINSFYNYTEHGKASLEFSEHLEPTADFINAVEYAIESRNPENFKQITEEYGQFIPIEVILGGRAYYEGHKVLKEYSEVKANKGSINISGGPIENRIGIDSTISKGKSNSYQHECTKIIGGQEPESIGNFDEKAWVKSLKDFRNWDCIEFKNPISIFQPLSEKLRKRIILSLGKKIHYSTINNTECNFVKLGEPFMYELRIPHHISTIIHNQDADCNIFATVIDAEENAFNCQILCPPNAKPNLLIYCIQERFREQKCKLKIGWMVIGYYTDLNFILSEFDDMQLKIIKNDLNATSETHYSEHLNFDCISFSGNVPCIGIPVLKTLDFSKISHVIGHRFFNVQEENKVGSYTFSYSLKEHICVKLPKFTFYTLIISNYHDPKAYGISPCRRSTIINRIRNTLTRTNPSTKLNPKYVSLFLTAENNYGPIFPRQISNKVEYINISCDHNSCTCRNNVLNMTENLKYAFFDPEK